MRIDHEMETKVARYATVDDALRALYPTMRVKKSGADDVHRIDVVSGLMYGTFLFEKPRAEADPQGASAVARIRRQALAREYEDLSAYLRICALVSFSREWRIPDLYRALDDRGYVPASTSESTAFLRLLAAQGVPLGAIFHLGTHITNERFEVQKLLAHDNGRVELVTMYDRTMVRPSWRIVAVKKEKDTSVSAALGCQK